MKIAVLIDAKATILPFFSSGMVETYSDESGEWKRVSRVSHDMDGELTMNTIRSKAEQFIAQLDNCNQIILKNVVGFAKPVLEEYNINIWVYKGELNAALLNHIRTEILIKQAENARSVPQPQMVDDPEQFCYKLDICQVDNCHAESEAGEVIISFFQNTHFKEFTVLCREKLIWLKALSELFQLDMAVKLLPDEVWKMTIVPLDFETGLLHRKTIRISQLPGHEDCSTCNTSDSCIPELLKLETEQQMTLT